MFYSKDGFIYNKNFLEMFFPLEYFKDDYYAINYGNKVNIFGLFPVRETINGKPGEIKTLTLPTFIDIPIGQMRKGSVTVNGKSLDVYISEYTKDSKLIDKFIPQTPEIGTRLVHMIIDGKLPPNIIEYNEIINVLWRSLSIAGIDLRVNSTLYEALIATMSRNPKNLKERFGIGFGKSISVSPLDYVSLNTRDAVANLSTFSGIAFEDLDAMITNGITNTINKIDEPESPLEKLIYL